MPLVGGADLKCTFPGDPSYLRFDHPYRASPTGLPIIYVTCFLAWPSRRISILRAGTYGVRLWAKDDAFG
eukprot:6203805-Pleurochrysis_carterae.AAC.2